MVKKSDVVERMVVKLDLSPHPEGGFYRETYRAAQQVTREKSGKRSSGTGIYFLLPGGVCTNWHRVHSDELWHFYYGDALALEIIDGEGEYHSKQLSGDFSRGSSFQALVPCNCWQRAYSKGAFSLAGCTVNPGFEFDDFEMIAPGELALHYPRLEDQIKREPF